MKIKNNGKFEQPIKINLGGASGSSASELKNSKNEIANFLGQSFWNNVELSSDDMASTNRNLGTYSNNRGLFYNMSHMSKTPKFTHSKDYVIKDMSSMFENCYNLETVTEDYNVKGIENVDRMFYNCYRLKSMPDFDFSKVKTAVETFKNVGQGAGGGAVINAGFNLNNESTGFTYSSTFENCRAQTLNLGIGPKTSFYDAFNNSSFSFINFNLPDNNWASIKGNLDFSGARVNRFYGSIDGSYGANDDGSFMDRGAKIIFSGTGIDSIPASIYNLKNSMILDNTSINYSYDFIQYDPVAYNYGDDLYISIKNTPLAQPYDDFTRQERSSLEQYLWSKGWYLVY